MNAVADDLEPTIVRGSTLRTQVKDAIEDLIVYGRLKPAEHLVEGALAERLGVSRQPVREALQTLAGAGFIDLVASKGAFVHRPTPREVQEVFHVRSVLEADAAALAAVNLQKPDIEQLAAIVEEGTRLAESGDSRTLLDLNSRFHNAITEAAANRVTRRILSDLNRRVAWFLATIIADRAPSSWTEHAEILHALRARDAEAAARYARAHVLNSLEQLEFAALN
jgi:DNA-binding GntR family transcriptional regulator